VCLMMLSPWGLSACLILFKEIAVDFDIMLQCIVFAQELQHWKRVTLCWQPQTLLTDCKQDARQVPTVYRC
jgi:hypothetical protein